MGSHRYFPDGSLTSLLQHVPQIHGKSSTLSRPGNLQHLGHVFCIQHPPGIPLACTSFSHILEWPDHPLYSNICDFHCAPSFDFMLSLLSSSRRVPFYGVEAFVPAITLRWRLTMDHSSISSLISAVKGCPSEKLAAPSFGCVLLAAICDVALCSASSLSEFSKGVHIGEVGGLLCLNILLVYYWLCTTKGGSYYSLSCRFSLLDWKGCVDKTISESLC